MFCNKQIKIATERITALRTDEQFDHIFQQCTKIVEISLKRGQKIEQICNFYKILYYQVIDNILM